MGFSIPSTGTKMDQAALVDRQRTYLVPFTDARALVESLDEAGFEFVGAFWLYTSEYEEWRFYVATPLVEKVDKRPFYRQVSEILDACQPRLDVALTDIMLVHPGEPVVKALRKAYHVEAGDRPIHVRNGMLSGVYVDEALIYRMI